MLLRIQKIEIIDNLYVKNVSFRCFNLWVINYMYGKYTTLPL